MSKSNVCEIILCLLWMIDETAVEQVSPSVTLLSVTLLSVEVNVKATVTNNRKMVSGG